MQQTLASNECNATKRIISGSELFPKTEKVAADGAIFPAAVAQKACFPSLFLPLSPNDDPLVASPIARSENGYTRNEISQHPCRERPACHPLATLGGILALEDAIRGE